MMGQFDGALKQLERAQEAIANAHFDEIPIRNAQFSESASEQIEVIREDEVEVVDFDSDETFSDDSESESDDGTALGFQSFEEFAQKRPDIVERLTAQEEKNKSKQEMSDDDDDSTTWDQKRHSRKGLLNRQRDRKTRK